MSADAFSKLMKLSFFIITICVAVAAGGVVKKVHVLPGGLQEQSTDDRYIQGLASLSANRFSMASSSPFHMKLVDVKGASKQVVTGILYRLKIEVGPTKCMKSAGLPKNISECEELECMPRETCDVTIWEKQWENFTEIQKFYCDSGAKRC